MSDKVLFADLADANVDVDAFLDHVGAAIDQLKPDFELRIPLAEHGKDRRNVIPAQAQAGADA